MQGGSDGTLVRMRAARAHWPWQDGREGGGPMTEPEFSATGVRIERWPRSLTTAGEIRIEGGRLALLTSYGREIDSAPVRAVRAGRPWFAARDAAVATLNGARYRLTMTQGAAGRRPGRRRRAVSWRPAQGGRPAGLTGPSTAASCETVTAGPRWTDITQGESTVTP